MEESEIDLRAILGLLKRQLRLIFAVVVLGLAATGLALYFMIPIYTAETLVMVDPAPKDLLAPEAQTPNLSNDSARVDGEVELVRVETNLLRTVQALDLVNDPEFGVHLGLRDRLLAFVGLPQPELPTGEEALQTVMSNLRDAVTVQRRGLTYLLAIRARSGDPEMSSRIANTLTQAYIQQQLESKVNATLSARDIISERIEEAGAAVARSEDAFDQFVANNLQTIAEQTGRTDLLSVRRQLDALNSSRATLVASAQLAERGLSRQDWSAVARALQSEAITSLEAQRQELEQRLAGAAQGSQAAIDLRAELSQLEAELESQVDSDLTQFRSQIADAQTRVSELQQRLRTGVLEADLPAGILTSIYELQQSAEIARSQYQTFLERLNGLEAQAYLQQPDVRIVSEAVPPLDPSFPNHRLVLMLAGLGSLGLAIGLAFLVENYIGGFTSEDQLEAVLRMRVAAAVPRQKENDLVENSLADLIVASPLSVFSEAVRRIRMGTELASRRARAGSPSDKGIVVLVTSAVPGEGKSTMALSIARSYGLLGKNTLLIDADLRKPSIHRHLGIEPDSGLLDYLASNEDGLKLQKIVTPDSEGLQAIVGARPSEMATDQLASGDKLSRLIRLARDVFEVVVVDSPPIAPVVDGLYLAGFADVVVFVVQWANTSQREAKSAVDAIVEAKRPETEIVGVLNQQDISRSTYRSKYSAYYGYG